MQKTIVFNTITEHIDYRICVTPQIRVMLPRIWGTMHNRF